MNLFYLKGIFFAVGTHLIVCVWIKAYSSSFKRLDTRDLITWHAKADGKGFCSTPKIHSNCDHHITFD